MSEMEERPIETTFAWFCEIVLKMQLYDWQVDAVMPFDNAAQKMTRVTLATPNGSGKSAIVIPTLVLGWLFFYPKGRVALTTADFKQLENQVMPAINAHSSKFPSWKFTECRIETPTGGFFTAFTTNDEGRVEGFHPVSDLDGPLLVIVDEAKSVPEEIFMAMDRGSYNGLLLTSSPGKMHGRFYDSHYAIPGFRRIRAGLADCPHISPDKIKRLEEAYGPDGATPNPAFLASTLHGEFMIGDTEQRFDREGLEYLLELATAEHSKAYRGVLTAQPWLVNGNKAQTWGDDVNGWVWMREQPIPGRKYIGFNDPMTGAQSEGSKNRDTHAAGILGAAYSDDQGKWHEAQLVAALYVPSTEEMSGAACRWDNDVLASRHAMLLRHYGNCPVVVEANNSGTEVIRLLSLEGCNLWQREKPNHRNPHKKLEVVGFQTTNLTKNYWVGAMGASIRDGTLICRFLPAVKQMQTFILNDKGTGEAQPGAHDDWITGLGMGMLQINAATEMPRAFIVPVQQFGGVTIFQNMEQQSAMGACS